MLGNTGIAGGCFDELPSIPIGSYVDSQRCAWLLLDGGIELKG